MIHAAIDVDIIDNPRMLQVTAGARDLWLWGMLYCQKHLTDGAIAMAAVLASVWGHGLKKNIVAATELVDVGLWERTDTGFQVCRYAKKNQLRKDVEAKRAAARQRMERVRANKSNGSREQIANVRAADSEHVLAVPGDGVGDGDGVCSGGGGPGEGSDLPDVPALKPSTARYREAYCAGITEAKGSPYAWPPGPQSKFADEDLGLAIATFGKSKAGQAHRGDKLTAWISAAAHDFAAHVIAAGDDPKYWSNFAPKGLVKFLNGEVRAEEARHVG